MTKPPTGLGVRHLQVLLLFILLFATHTIRVNISVAIVAMVANTSNLENYEDFYNNQSIILSSFLWGYVAILLPIGPIAKRFGPKIVLVVGIALCSILSLLTPLVAHKTGWIGLCVIRAIQGFTQGGLYPCTHTLLTKWAPLPERGRLATICYAGGVPGIIFMMAISGVLITSRLGWEGIFYLSGILGLISVILWAFIGANTPQDSRWVSDEEKTYIIATTSSISAEESKALSIPWLAIMTSVPFLALLIAHISYLWGYWVFLTSIPTYMNDILEFEIKSNALLSALPYLVMWIMSFIFCFAADYLHNRQILEPQLSRKIFNSIGLWLPMLILCGLGYVSKEYKYWAVALLTLAAGFNAATFVGYLINHMDLSPNFAGTMMGITNFSANFVSIFAPILVGEIISAADDPTTGWRIVFFISAGIYFVGNLIFVIFGRGVVQHWNFSKPTNQQVALISRS